MEQSTIMLVIFLVAMLLSIPIALALGFAAMVTIVFISDIPPSVVIQSIYSSTDNFTLMGIPFFMLAGNLMKTGGVSRRLVNFAKILVGSFPGGLGHVAIVTCMIFAAISGSGPATVAAVGLIMIPYMVEAGYDIRYASALNAAAGGIGVIIPPSIPMVLFAVIAEVSIAEIFAAGFLPGALIGLLLMAVNYAVSKRRGYRGEKVELSVRAFWRSFVDAFLSLMMPVIILGGIYSGIFTPTEAAGVAVVYGFVLGIFIYREIHWRELTTILLDSAVMSAICIIILAMVAPFGWVLTMENFAIKIAEMMSGLFNSQFTFLLAINCFLLFWGCFVSSTAALIILTPILLPIVDALGINIIHFGIIMVLNLELGMLTPPFGINLFIACGISKINIEEIVKPLMLFVAATLTGLFLITYVPWISLAVPRLMGLGT
ncbi:MAG: TRAP transporter large permease subunit [Rhodospirillales bacterium]|jgi:C4-dicarboxylate transporter DctM subunit|nr:TRAP transporter large permease subunit [Rhodospirillales bacterium]